MEQEVLREELVDFSPAAGDWVAVFVDTTPSSARPPWHVASIAGWAIVDVEDGERSPCRVIRPVIGGETIDWQEDNYIGIYRRADLNDPDVRNKLDEICGLAHAHAARMEAPE